MEIHFHKRLGCLSFPQLYELSSNPASRVSFHIVRWSARPGCLILNTDGCSKGNPGCSGGGGILRDASGGPILAFSAFFGIRSSLHAEALAMLTGLRMCVKQGFVTVDLQSDSRVLVGIIQRRFRCPWQIRPEIEQIWDLAATGVRVSHCYREANRVADILANVGVSHPQQGYIMYDSTSIISKLAKGEIRLDKLGMSSVRRIVREVERSDRVRDSV
ncbi:uncharacterized protein [Coffea arabica]|uniref:RNase H type-1 domain-containing protein n=1 Tax=Coffea arabica TaxID=13443 RepID=A0ABM4U4N4_COFAR